MHFSQKWKLVFVPTASWKLWDKNMERCYFSSQCLPSLLIKETQRLLCLFMLFQKEFNTQITAQSFRNRAADLDPERTKHTQSSLMLPFLWFLQNSCEDSESQNIQSWITESNTAPPKIQPYASHLFFSLFQFVTRIILLKISTLRSAYFKKIPFFGAFFRKIHVIADSILMFKKKFDFLKVLFFAAWFTWFLFYSSLTCQ